MDTIEPVRTPKRSIGKLRKANKTKPRSPDMVGEVLIQRHLIKTINEQFAQTADDELPCCLAGWVNNGNEGQCLTVEISPKYVRREYRPQERNTLSFIFADDEEA
jgi:hypothetical protein